MAALTLTPADTFVELPPIAPDPSVTFSQGHCLLAFIKSQPIPTGTHVINTACYISPNSVRGKKKYGCLAESVTFLGYSVVHSAAIQSNDNKTVPNFKLIVS